MKRRTGKKIGKILLLVALLAIVGGIVYAVLTWPMYPDRQKPAESYQQMKQTAEDLGVLAPPEDVLPWTQPEYDFWLDNTWRFARPCGYTMAGDISYEGTVYSAYIVAFRETGASDDYPTLRENYKTVPIYVQSGDGGVKMQFIVEGHLYQVGMMAPPESALTQDVTDYFDGLLLAMVGGIVYTVLTWPIYPQPRKNVDSYQQLRQDMEKTGVLVPPENVLPWVETFYSQELDGRDRLSKPRAFLMSGTVEYGGASYRAEIFESQKWTFEWRAEISLRENYRMTPIYRDAWDDSVLYFLSIDGHIYTVTVYADGKMPQDAVDYFDGLLLEACHTVVDLYQ